MAQLGYKGFYCMGVWSFTVHNIMKNMWGFCFYSQSQRWWGFDLMTSASTRKTSREKVVSGKFRTTFEGERIWVK